MVSESGSITVHTDAALPVFLLTHTLVCSVVSSLSPVVREICFLALQIQFQDFFLLEGGSLFVCTRMCVSGCVPGQVLGRQTCWKWVKDAHTHTHTLGGDYVVPSARLEHSVVWLIRPGTLMDEHTRPANKHTHTATCDAIDAHTPCRMSCK